MKKGQTPRCKQPLESLIFGSPNNCPELGEIVDGLPLCELNGLILLLLPSNARIVSFE
jgi:hypothetical protein